MQQNWFDFITRYTKIIEAGYELAKDFEQGGLTGEVREYFIEMFLKKIIPESMGIGSGKIIDREGTKSLQIDLLIYDKKFPVLKFTEDASLFPIEGVVATIEVKSTLDGELTNALYNCKSVTDLHPTVAKNTITEAQLKSGDTAVEWAYPATYIFSYRHYKENAAALRDAVVAWHNEALNRQNKSRGEKKNSLGLLSFPRMTVTEGCLAVRTNNLLGISTQSGAHQVAFGAKKTEYKLHIFICDLLRIITQRSSFVHPNVPECKFGIEAYFNTKELILEKIGDQNWEYITRTPIMPK